MNSTVQNGYNEATRQRALHEQSGRFTDSVGKITDVLSVFSQTIAIREQRRLATAAQDAIQDAILPHY